MGSIQRFEDLIAWQKARALTQRIYEFTRRPDFARDFALSRQLQRAAITTMAHIAEGFERGSRPEFASSLFVAKSSCAELRCELYVAFDVGYITEEELADLLVQAEEVARIIGGLRVSVARDLH